MGRQWPDICEQARKAAVQRRPYKWQKKLTKEHGMQFCDIHSLRHFNATVLIHSGIDAAAVSSALGHSSISTTNIYCHAFNEAQARTGNAIAAALDFTSSSKLEVSENKRTEMPPLRAHYCSQFWRREGHMKDKIAFSVQNKSPANGLIQTFAGLWNVVEPKRIYVCTRKSGFLYFAL